MKLVTAVATLALVVTTTACGLGARPSVPPDGAGVAMLGDSIMYSAVDELTAELPGAVIDAVPGRTMVVPAATDAGIEKVPVLAERAPKTWVVELGTNDAFVGSRRTDADLVADVGALLAAIDATTVAGEACVWWVLPHLAPPVARVSIERARLVADTARRAVSDRSCGGALDWPEVATAFPDALDADGIHLTGNGQTLFAAMVADALRAQQ